MKAFYWDASVHAERKGDIGERFGVQQSMTQVCVMSLWLFHLFMDREIRTIKVGVDNVVIEMKR